jgi:hypothetical protein
MGGPAAEPENAGAVPFHRAQRRRAARAPPQIGAAVAVPYRGGNEIFT